MYIEKQYKRNIAQGNLEVGLLGLVQHEYIHQLIEGKQDPQGRWATIWFEYIEHGTYPWKFSSEESNMYVGTLKGLIERHADEGLQIFERFCWKVFWQIAMAMRYCHHSDGEVRGWHPIIHRNLTVGLSGSRTWVSC
jgi:hypothetical protein